MTSSAIPTPPSSSSTHSDRSLTAAHKAARGEEA